MALTPADAVLSVGQRIGRYFALISMIPALFLVLWIYILIVSGAISGAPSFHNIQDALTQWPAGKIIELTVATLATAVVLHPLQFATTQLLEGYWGTTPLAIAAMQVRVAHHRKHRRNLLQQAATHRNALKQAKESFTREIVDKDPRLKEDEAKKDLDRKVRIRMAGPRGDSLAAHHMGIQEATDHASKYPGKTDRILPTQLGNALRCFEDSAGSQYGLSALLIAPHLHLIVPDLHRQYLIDARQSMDSAIRICTVGLVATIVTVGFMLTHGLWLLCAIVPYSVSYLAYKGAVSAAYAYGRVVESVIDLDRFLLYKKLHAGQPEDSQEEKKNNIELMKMLSGQDANISYRQGKGSSRPRA